MAIRISPPSTSALPASQPPNRWPTKTAASERTKVTSADDQHRNNDVDGQQGEAEADGQRVDAGGHGQAQHDRQAHAAAAHAAVAAAPRFADHLAADERQQDEGQPMVEAGDDPLEAQAGQPADDRHQRLEKAEKRSQEQGLAPVHLARAAAQPLAMATATASMDRPRAMNNMVSRSIGISAAALPGGTAGKGNGRRPAP